MTFVTQLHNKAVVTHEHPPFKGRIYGHTVYQQFGEYKGVALEIEHSYENWGEQGESSITSLNLQIKGVAYSLRGGWATPKNDHQKLRQRACHFIDCLLNPSYTVHGNINQWYDISLVPHGNGRVTFMVYPKRIT
jgi:hypothetical protein